MNTPSLITFLREFLDWSNNDARVGEVAHSKLIDKATALFSEFEGVTSPALRSAKQTFDLSASTLATIERDHPNDPRLPRLRIARDCTEAFYMEMYFRELHRLAGVRFDEAARNEPK